MSSNFVLGTANFGAKYGISNGNLVLQEHEIDKIVALAENSGLFQFDTAPAYGNAESQLGLSLKHPETANIFTKISGEDSKSVTKMLDSAKRSLERTRVSKFSGIYLHDESIFETANPNEIIVGIRELLDSGITERVGISVYSMEAVVKAKDICSELNLFQVPENICDRRLCNSQVMKDIAQAGDSIYVRSIFLQGLLLMEPNQIPKEFSKIVPAIEKLTYYANFLNVSKKALCLSYARNILWADGIVIGVASFSQIEELLEPAVTLPEDFESHIPSFDLDFLDPRNWPKLK
jgi:aryl-alcohol dehydrogenase-like predicted oxidoreductase